MDQKALAAMISEVLAKYAQGPKPKARKKPRGFKVCRCKALIPKDWPLCGRCTQWEDDDWLAGGPDRRKMMLAVIKECNA